MWGEGYPFPSPTHADLMLFIVRCSVCGKWKRETATRTLTPCACSPEQHPLGPWILGGIFVGIWALCILSWLGF